MSRIGKCICRNCQNDGYKTVYLWKRGNKNGMICREHYLRIQGYNVENNIRRGIITDGFTYSIELETSRSNDKTKIELFDVDFIATRDCTVDIEFKSPIYLNLKAPVKHAVTIERLLNEGHVEMNRSCGTHFHVGHGTYINPTTMRYLRRFYNSLFVPLSNAIMEDEEKSARFFGRKPNDWAQPITMNTISGNLSGNDMPHKAMFNLQHDYTVEFRQPKFKNAKQYQEVMNFSKDIVSCLIENFIKHFMDTEWDRNRYPKRTDYRKHKASVTAQKMVSIYKKYTENL